MNEPPQRPIPPRTRQITFTTTGENYIEQIEKQLEWLKGLTLKELQTQTKIKIV